MQFSWLAILTFVLVLGVICFCISSEVYKFFVEVISFSFCLVKSLCVSYLTINHSLVYSYPKIFALFRSLIQSLNFSLTPYFLIQFSVLFLFGFLFLGLASCNPCLEDAIFEIRKSAKRPQCNSNFMNKIGGGSNTEFSKLDS